MGNMWIADYICGLCCNLYSTCCREEELTLEGMLGKANLEAQKDRKRMQHVYKSRKIEAARARAADMMMRSERGSTGSLLKKSTLTPSSSIADINQISGSYKRREKFCKRMSPFGIKKQTYVPGIADGTRKYQLKAINDLSLAKAYVDIQFLSIHFLIYYVAKECLDYRQQSRCMRLGIGNRENSKKRRGTKGYSDRIDDN